MISTISPLARRLPTIQSIVRICLHLAAFIFLIVQGNVWAADEPMAETAKGQFDRGLELAGKGDYQGALQSFGDAYLASPNFAVLYNIGQAQVALGRPLDAAASLSRYLQEGQGNVSAERRRQVEEQIKLLESFMVELDVTTEPYATISVDGRRVATTSPSEPIRLTAGTHKITATVDQSAPSTPATTSLAKAAECPAATTSRALQDQPPAKPARARSAVRTALPYALAGAGVALGAGALGVYLWKRGDYEQWQAGEAALQKETPGSATYQARAADNQRLAGSLTAANHTILGLAIAGGVLVAAGGSLYLFDWSSARKSTGFSVAWAGGSSVTAGWGGSW